MKRLLRGVCYVVKERPKGFWLWIVYWGSFVLIVRERGVPMLGEIMTLLCAAGFLFWAYSHGENKPGAAPSGTVLTETAALSMRVVKTESDGVPRYQANNNIFGGALKQTASDKGYLGNVFVVFENQSGGPVQTDTSFALERQRGLKWYAVPPVTESDGPWEAVELPAGTSAPICLNAFGRYPYLSHGNYRVVKSLRLPEGQVTLAACFSIDSFT